MRMHQEVTKKQETEFRQWARDNYTAGDKICEIWHPVVRDECNLINQE